MAKRKMKLLTLFIFLISQINNVDVIEEKIPDPLENVFSNFGNILNILESSPYQESKLGVSQNNSKEDSNKKEDADNLGDPGEIQLEDSQALIDKLQKEIQDKAESISLLQQKYNNDYEKVKILNEYLKEKKTLLKTLKSKCDTSSIEIKNIKNEKQNEIIKIKADFESKLNETKQAFINKAKSFNHLKNKDFLKIKTDLNNIIKDFIQKTENIFPIKNKILDIKSIGKVFNKNSLFYYKPEKYDLKKFTSNDLLEKNLEDYNHISFPGEIIYFIYKKLKYSLGFDNTDSYIYNQATLFSVFLKINRFLLLKEKVFPTENILNFFFLKDEKFFLRKFYFFSPIFKHKELLSKKYEIIHFLFKNDLPFIKKIEFDIQNQNKILPQNHSSQNPKNDNSKLDNIMNPNLQTPNADSHLLPNSDNSNTPKSLNNNIPSDLNEVRFPPHNEEHSLFPNSDQSTQNKDTISPNADEKSLLINTNIQPLLTSEINETRHGDQTNNPDNLFPGKGVNEITNILDDINKKINNFDPNKNEPTDILTKNIPDLPQPTEFDELLNNAKNLEIDEIPQIVEQIDEKDKLKTKSVLLQSSKKEPIIPLSIAIEKTDKQKKDMAFFNEESFEAINSPKPKDNEFEKMINDITNTKNNQNPFRLNIKFNNVPLQKLTFDKNALTDFIKVNEELLHKFISRNLKAQYIQNHSFAIDFFKNNKENLIAKSINDNINEYFKRVQNNLGTIDQYAYWLDEYITKIKRLGYFNSFESKECKDITNQNKK